MPKSGAFGGGSSVARVLWLLSPGWSKDRGGSKKAHVSPGLRRGEGPQFEPQVRKADSERTRELESHIVLINRTVICQ